MFCINDINYKNKEVVQKYYHFSRHFRNQLCRGKSMAVCITKVLLINLNRSTDRYTYFMNNLNDNTFDIVRIPAFDGSQLTDAEFTAIKQDNTKFQGLSCTNKGQYACWKSHMKCCQYIVDNAIEWCLILEDDAKLPPRLSDQLQQLEIPMDADIIYVHNRGKKCKRKHYDAKYDYYIDGYGADAMIVSYNFAYQMLNSVYSTVYYMQVDTLLTRLGKTYKSSFTSNYRRKLTAANITIKNLKFNLYLSKTPLLENSIFQKCSTIF